jgi:hypothetical protein
MDGARQSANFWGFAHAAACGARAATPIRTRSEKSAHAMRYQTIASAGDARRLFIEDRDRVRAVRKDSRGRRPLDVIRESRSKRESNEIVKTNGAPTDKTRQS